MPEDDDLTAASRLEDRLYGVPGVAAVRVAGWGGPEAQIGFLVGSEVDIEAFTAAVMAVVEAEPDHVKPELRIVPLAEADWCCGSAGIYNVTQPELSAKLLHRIS